MYHYEYVTRKEAMPYRDEFLEIIHAVQDVLREDFTFKYRFVGSSSRNMITFDPTTNRGFDFDVNLYVNDPEEDYSPETIKSLLMRAIDQVAWMRGFAHCENSTRVITLKKIALSPFPRIECSCDFAIVHDYTDKRNKKHQQYIHFQKSHNRYLWNEQQKGYDLEVKEKWIKKQGLWNEVLKLYLWKKNNNIGLKKKSRSLYAETINEIHKKYVLGE